MKLWLLSLIPALLSGASSIPSFFEPAADGIYATRAARYTAELSSTGAVFRAGQHEVRMRLDGARHVSAIASEKQPGVTHYYLGGEPQTFVPHFGRVEYPGVYAGIDVQYYFNGRDLEYDFILAPGAQASQIRLQFEGIEKLSINGGGELELLTAAGVLKKRRPVAYQQIAGRRMPVESAFVTNGRAVSFSVGRYDARYPLVIDPSVVYATYFGGSGQDDANAIAVDATGAVYLTGTTQSTSLPRATRTASTAVGFVTKLNADGRTAAYTVFLSAIANAITVDAAGVAYLAGSTGSGLAVVNAFQPAFGGTTDAFVMKLNANGTVALSSYLGGSGIDDVSRNGIALDKAGAVYVAGSTRSANFPVSNAFKTTFGDGISDAFLTKLDAATGAVLYSTFVGGTGYDATFGLTVDAENNPVLAGQTQSNDFPLVNPLQANPGGDFDGFVTRFRADGTGILYSTRIGGVTLDNVFFVAAQTDGALVISGNAFGRPFLNRISPTNQMTTLLSPRDGIGGLVIDGLGNIVVMSSTNMVDPAIPMVSPVRANPISFDPLVVQLAPTGEVLFSTFWGGAGGSFTCCIAADSTGGIYLALSPTSADVYTANAVQPAFAGVRDAFVVKFGGTTTQRVSALVTSANFDAVPVTVNDQSYSGRRSFQNVSGATYTVSVPETLDIGNLRYSFVRWNDDGPRTRTVTMGDDDVILNAVFTVRVKPTLQVSPSAAGTIAVSPTTLDGYYPVGTPLTFTAVPAPGYAFSAWSGNLSGTSNPQNYTAQFVQDAVALTVTANFRLSSAPPPQAGNTFVSVTPCRVFDSRDGSGKTGAFGPPVLERGSIRTIPIPQGGCNTALNASAYAFNVTVVPQEPLSYLTAWPAGQPQPVVSTLNSFDGQAVANAAIVPAGASGAIHVYVSNRTHLIIDVIGYFTPDVLVFSQYFTPLTPCRLMDTRATAGEYGPNGAPPLTPAFPRGVVAQGLCGIPATSQSVSLNVTAVPQGPLGYLTATSLPLFPNVSTVNSTLGQVRANAAITGLSFGQFSLFTSDTADAVIDVNGYFSIVGGFRFYPITPCRLADTRTGSGFGGLFGAPSLVGGVRRDFSIVNSGCNVPSQARAFSLNATVLPKEPLAYLTLWPAGSLQPLVSTLNAFEGQVLANAAIVPAGTGGAVSVFATGVTDLILDINGYFAP